MNGLHIGAQGLLTGLSLIVALGPQNVLLLRQGIRRESLFAVFLICLLGDLLMIPVGTLLIGAVSGVSPALMVVFKLGGAAFLLWFGWTCLRSSMNPQPFTVDPVVSPLTDGADRAHRDQGRTATANPGFAAPAMTTNAANGAIPSAPTGAAETTETAGASGPAVSESTSLSAVATLTRTEQASPAPWTQAAMRPAQFLTPAVISALTMTFLNPGAYIDNVLMVGSIANQFGEVGRWWFTGGAMAASALWFPLITFGARALSTPLAKPAVNKWLDRCIAVLMAVMATRLLLA